MKASSYFLPLALWARESLALQQRASNWTVGQVVSTSSGPVTGHAALVSTDVSEYLGIPFAVPPLGDLRWTAPQLFNGTSPINGTSFGFSCPIGAQVSPNLEQIQAANVTAAGLTVLAALGEIGNNFSEDCLTLNVWTKPQVGEAQKAVLVWIYGGAFAIGSSDNQGYTGQFLSELEDVVVVSLNYRVNVFGFPGAPNVTQNLGLLDQRLAVEWVQKNIANFGGDPTRITIFGQSAGSASVDYYSYAWVEDPIVHSFIQQSGSVFGPAQGLGAISPATAEGYWNNLTSVVGCGNATTDPTAALACMKSKSFEDIIAGLDKTTSGQGSAIASSFSPTVDNITVFSNYTALSLAGNFSKLPLLVGNNDYEAGLFKILDDFDNVTLSDAAWDVFNTVGFTCPSSARANVSVANNVPTWRYRWFGAFPNTEISTVPFSGAWHASELPVIFDAFPSGGTIPNATDAENAIGTYVRGAWATFAKNPTTGLLTYEDGWPMYAPGENTLIQLAFQNLTGTNLARGTTYDNCVASLSTLFSAPANGTLGNTTASSTGSGSSSSTSVSTGSSATATSNGRSLKELPATGSLLSLMACMILLML